MYNLWQGSCFTQFQGKKYFFLEDWIKVKKHALWVRGKSQRDNFKIRPHNKKYSRINRPGGGPGEEPLCVRPLTHMQHEPRPSSRTMAGNWLTETPEARALGLVRRTEWWRLRGRERGKGRGGSPKAPRAPDTRKSWAAEGGPPAKKQDYRTLALFPWTEWRRGTLSNSHPDTRWAVLGNSSPQEQWTHAGTRHTFLFGLVVDLVIHSFHNYRGDVYL